MELSKITLTVHKDPLDFLMRDLDLTVLLENGREVTYHRKTESSLIIAHFISFLNKLDDVFEKHFAEPTLTLNRGGTENARDEKDREPQASSSTDPDGKGSPQEGEG